MSTNASLAEIFESMADLLELTGANPFRVNAHRRVARAMESLGEDAAAIVGRDPSELTTIEGIGGGSAKKIEEFVRTGRIKEHQELLAEVPPGVPAMLRIPGLGPKTVRMLWNDAGIEDIAGLRTALDAGRLEGLPRLGPKSIANLRESLDFLEKSGGRARLGSAMPVAEAIVAMLAGLPGVERAAFAGSLRRGRETIGDLDILVAADNAGPVSEAFQAMDPKAGGAPTSGARKGAKGRGAAGKARKGAPAAAQADEPQAVDGEALAHAATGDAASSPHAELPRVAKVLAAGETKTSVRLDNGMQADLRVVPLGAFGAALLHFTGSKEHNVRLRERAIARGFRLNEYGLFPDDGEPAPQDRGVRPVAGKTEEEIYEALGLPWIPPELREDHGECSEPIPTDLVTIDDIRAELHAHTTASDGAMSIEALARAAKAQGFHTIAVTDHSRSSVQANGLSPERLLAHIDAIRAAEAKIGGIRLLAGSEVDIHADGSLDYDDELLARLDLVIASPHASLRQEPATATARLLAAVRHPLVHCIGHPTGRIINGRPGLEPDMPAIIAAARECGTALEINANHLRLDLRDAHVRMAVDAGVTIAINCDVHGEGDFNELRYGVMTARRGWLPRSLCINTWERDAIEAWLRAKRTTSTSRR
ncbi:MAG: PHP domain-containing protein [Phycisphaeraceae bacterium]|nr:PHP domain-containing protein [Phycisphaeraceae bacterium]